MKRIFILLVSLAAVLGLIAGCSSTTTPTSDVTVEDFGTYTAADEAPAFGDPDLKAIAAEEVVFDDPAVQLPALDSLENLDSSAIYCFRMVWGNLAADTGVTTPTDWSGKLTLSRGAVVVTRIIRFEPGQDSLVLDTNVSLLPTSVEWVSTTTIGSDGLALRLIVPPSPTDEIVTVAFESSQLSITFSLDELDGLDTMVVVGFGNAASFQSFRCDGGYRHGALAGVWGRDTLGLGVFYGTWISSNGMVIGTVKGDWGTDSLGHQYFVGKYINETGGFEGFVKGNWYLRGQGKQAAGHFAGLIYDADKEPIGVLKGHFKPGNSKRTGYFAGRWCVGGDCFATPHLEE